MSKKTTRLLIIFLVAILITLFFRKRIQSAIYDLKVQYHLKTSIVWTDSDKLKWSDFHYNPEAELTDNISSDVGILQRYHVDENIDYKSYTLFKSKKSIVSDTTDPLSLRIAQARFDLCEVYRKKLSRNVYKIQVNADSDITVKEIEKLWLKYTDDFENDWAEFMSLETHEVKSGLLKLEERIRKELE